MQEFLPPYRSMNLAVYTDNLNQYKDMDELKKTYENGGLNGLEVILAMDEAAKNKIPSEMINGVHLYFHIFWMAMFKGDMEWLLSEFDSKEQMVEYFSGDSIEGYLNCLRHDLQYAKNIGAKYVVFHVSEVNLNEVFTNEARYSDEEVIDAAAKMINRLLSEDEYSFDFLVENLPWKGFGLQNPKLTKRMLDQIQYPKKGIMFDTGHFMNMYPELQTGEEGLTLIHKMLDEHEQAGIPITEWMKGMHLQLSLNGEFVKQYHEQCKLRGSKLPDGFEGAPFYERYRIANEFMTHFDEHRPFLIEGIEELVDRIRPKYLTDEFSRLNKEEYEKAILEQKKMLKWLT